MSRGRRERAGETKSCARGPKTHPGGPKIAPRGTKTAAKTLPKAPRELEDLLKKPPKRSKTYIFHKNLFCVHVQKKTPKAVPKMLCNRMAGGHAKKWRAGGGIPQRERQSAAYPRGAKQRTSDK